MQRHRVKGVIFDSLGVTLYYPLSGNYEAWGSGKMATPFVDFPRPLMLPKGYSSLSDHVGHGFWQPCSHVRMRLLPGYIGYFSDSGTATAVDGVDSPHYADIEDFQVMADERMLLARGEDFNTWFSGLYSSFTDQFPDTCSIANTLIEFKQGIRNQLPMVRDLKQRISSNYLKIQFGYKPLWNDLKACCKMYGKFKNRLKFLKENKVMFEDQRKLVLEPIVNYEKDYVAYYQAPDIPQPPGPPLVQPQVYHPLRTLIRDEWSEATHYATAFINNQIKGLDEVSRQVDAMAGMLGLCNPIKIAWNAVPWTWLCDWFVDVDQVLDAFEGQPFEGKLVLESAYLSTKIKSLSWVETVSQVGATRVSEEKGFLSTKQYDRSGELGIEEDLISSKLIHPSLDGGQAAILLALLDQRCKLVPDIASYVRKWRRRR